MNILCRLFGHEYKEVRWHISYKDSLIHLTVSKCIRCKCLRLRIYDAYMGMVYADEVVDVKTINEQLKKWKVNKITNKELEEIP